MFAHGLSIAALFAIAGQVRERTGTLAFSELGGLAKPMPVLGFAFGLAAFASIGLPGFANFASEILVFFGAFQNGTAAPFSHYQIATLFALWGVVISAVYMLRGYRAVFHGRDPGALEPASRTSPSLRWPVILLLAVAAPRRLFPADFRQSRQARRRCEFLAYPNDDRARFSRSRRPGHSASSCSSTSRLPDDRDKSFVAGMGIAGLGVVFIASFFVVASAAVAGPVTGWLQFYTADALALFFKRFALLTTIIVLVISLEYRDVVRRFIFGAHSDAGIGEFYTLPVFTCAGLMWMASAVDFVMIFVSLELVTISFYILVAYMRRNANSLEAGVKYLVLGALSTGFFVYGVTWIFGLTGATNLAQAADAHAPASRRPGPAALRLHAHPHGPRLQDRRRPLPVLGARCLSGRAHAHHRLSLASARRPPASSSSSAWSRPSSPSPSLREKVVAILSVVAALTLIYGNLAAMPQNNLKRLLAYSSIAHAGYLLIAVASLARRQLRAAAVAFYLAGYLLMTLLSFLVIVVVANATGGDDIANFNGLGKRSPGLAFAMLVAMLSLAGVPLTVGFFGKFFVFAAAIEQGHYVLAGHRHRHRRRRLLLLSESRPRHVLAGSRRRHRHPRRPAHPLHDDRPGRPHLLLRHLSRPHPPHAFPASGADAVVIANH